MHRYRNTANRVTSQRQSHAKRTSSATWVKCLANMFASQGLDAPRLLCAAGIDVASLPPWAQAHVESLQAELKLRELKIQQLETRLNQVSSQVKQPDRGSRLPKGAIKSLTYRTAEDGNRLRIYWADGSRTDLPCTKEQTTLVCG